MGGSVFHGHTVRVNSGIFLHFLKNLENVSKITVFLISGLMNSKSTRNRL